MTEKQKMDVRNMQNQRLRPEQKEDIKKFYPCLISLMHALLTRCDSKTQVPNSDPAVSRIVLDVWRDVMSKLNELFHVVVYGNTKRLIDLGQFPTDWDEIIREKNDKIALILTSARENKNAQLSLVQALNERDHTIEDVKTKYADKDMLLKLNIANATGYKHAFEACTQVDKMVDGNMENIKAIQN